MPSRTEWFRGKRTHGRGKKGGRGAGKRGGHGNAGLHKHKYNLVLKYYPDHFGRHGFKRHYSISKTDTTLNVGDLMQHKPKLLADGHARETGDILEIDLTASGITKLLGNGEVKFKFHIKVQKASARAVQKIEGAGGKVILPRE